MDFAKRSPDFLDFEIITLKTLSRQFMELLERYRVVRQCPCAVGLYADNIILYHVSAGA